MSDRVFNPEGYLGLDGIRRFVADVHDVWKTFTWEPTDMIDAGFYRDPSAARRTMASTPPERDGPPQRDDRGRALQ
jgi:hypothetical protein